ncbi:MAG: metallophosphoesterase [Roseburia sp.]|nr:metallophosphoesterase [Anaeroplasma bactoclasticum]MCM1195861.1 metallophosphoesterase [Roseburia sp.]MCM1556551.1 metallophosphoesterase [Anaeroplasma bactoclasticum]
MKILVLSDSHHTPLESLDYKKYDVVIHCGDYGNCLTSLTKNQVFFVRGNCDFFGEDYLFFSLYGKKIFVTHGHRENVKYGLNRLIYKSLEMGANITLFGHTHQQICFQEEGILFLNPGSYPSGYIEINEEEIKLHQNGKLKRIKHRW